MSEDGCLTVGMLLVVALAALALVFAMGKSEAHGQFRECRALLTTADSATVVRTKPECARWTLPPKEAPDAQ